MLAQNGRNLSQDSGKSYRKRFSVAIPNRDLTVHVPVVFVLDERIAARFTGLLAVNHINLHSDKKGGERGKR